MVFLCYEIDDFVELLLILVFIDIIEFGDYNIFKWINNLNNMIIMMI